MKSDGGEGISPHGDAGDSGTMTSLVCDADLVIAVVGSENKPTGRLVKASNSVSTTLYRFDGLGRPLASEQSTTGQSKLVFQYGHQPAGMASMKYPSGRVVNWSYDGAGRPNGVQGGVGVTDYVTGIQYSVFGGMSQLALGNTLVEKWSYSDKRGQVRRIALGTAASDASVGEWLFSHCAGQAGTGECTSNNGNVRSQTINPLGKTQSYGYDWMNRLTAMVEQSGIVAVPACTGAPGEPPCPCTGAAGDPPCRVYDHDQYGNMWVPVWTLFAPDSFTAVGQSNYSNGKNQLTIQNSTFDEAGNLKTIGGQTYSYDGENRVKASTSGSSAVYEYDGEGRRVKKGAIVFAYDAQGRLAAEYGGTLTGAGGRRYVTADHLGSTRVVTDGGGAVVSGQRHDYLPFGESLLAGVNGRTAAAQYGTTENLSGLARLFTGKERDSETGLDWFATRYLSSAQGRFTSPDSLLSSGRPDQPQSWNRYSYVLNNPLKFIDPSGQQEQGPCGPQQGDCTEVLQKSLQAGVQGAQNFVRNLVNAPVAAVNSIAGPSGGFVAPLPLPPLTSGDQGVDVGSKVAEMTIGLAPLLFSGGAAGAGGTNQLWGPATGQGPLSAEIANTFRSSTYTESITSEATTLYRAYGGQANEMGRFWSRTRPSGPLQATIDYALNPTWGNTAASTARMTVPPGTRIFEGAAASQGGLVGGGNQIFINRVNPKWLGR